MPQRNKQDWLIERRSLFFCDAWKWSVGIVSDHTQRSSYTMLVQTEWSAVFESLMRNRLIQGATRYGILKSKNKPRFNRIARAIQELDLYRLDKNAERLVDVANMMLLEFEEERPVLQSSGEEGIKTLEIADASTK